MNRLGKSLSSLAVLALLVPALAQEAVEPELYEPFGGVGYEVGAYEPLEGYEEGVTDEEIGGNLIVRFLEPGDQAIDIVLVGPDGYKDVGEVNAEEAIEVEGLTPGVYAIMATDDGLQPLITTVEVALGRVAPVTLDLNEMIEYEVGELGYGAETYEAYEPYGLYEVGYEPLEADVADFGDLIVRAVIPGAAGEGVEEEVAVVDAAISVVGPNDYREDFSSEGALEGIESGTYGVAATAEGYRMSQGVAAVRPGEVAAVTLTLEPLEATAMGEEEAVAAGEEEAVATAGAGLFGTFDADASGDISEEEFGTSYDAGLYSEFDADASGNITEEEFGTGFYNTVDADSDGIITTEEYEPYESQFGLGYDEFDTDASGEVTEEEFLGVF